MIFHRGIIHLNSVLAHYKCNCKHIWVVVVTHSLEIQGPHRYNTPSRVRQTALLLCHMLHGSVTSSSLHPTSFSLSCQVSYVLSRLDLQSVFFSVHPWRAACLATRISTYYPPVYWQGKGCRSEDLCYPLLDLGWVPAKSHNWLLYIKVNDN